MNCGATRVNFVASRPAPTTGDPKTPIIASNAIGLLHRISRVISRHGCNVELVLISTEGARAIDVFHLTAGGAKLADDARNALTADLQRMLEGRNEVD